MADGESPVQVNYFIDEAGTPTLFARRGKKIIVGQEGCSTFFMLGKIRVANPPLLRTELTALRSELLADPYFRDIPSMQPSEGKTAFLFHAKDDRPEVRREVFKLLLRHDIKFYAVVRNKSDLANFVLQQNVADPEYRFNENDLYHTLTRELFGRLRQTADELNLVFASRGNSTRNQALRQALSQADLDFQNKFGFARQHIITVQAKGSREDPCLQACDYFMWALQRHFEQNETGFIEMLWSKVGEIVDLDKEHGRRRGITYGPRRPLFQPPTTDGA